MFFNFYKKTLKNVFTYVLQVQNSWASWHSVVIFLIRKRTELISDVTGVSWLRCSASSASAHHPARSAQSDSLRGWDCERWMPDNERPASARPVAEALHGQRVLRQRWRQRHCILHCVVGQFHFSEMVHRFRSVVRILSPTLALFARISKPPSQLRQRPNVSGNYRIISL